MKVHEVKSKLMEYEKKCVFLKTQEIYCDFTYEWSVGATGKDELVAAERLLSWMLGNSYQSALMIQKCTEGQIPINETAFNHKCQQKDLLPICDIYGQFVFDTKE